jgi:predicted PurR-regulated permease PerM
MESVLGYAFWGFLAAVALYAFIKHAVETWPKDGDPHER